MAKSKSRKLADFISDSAIDTAELADSSITPAKLDSTGSYTVADLTVSSSYPDLVIEDSDGTNQSLTIQQVGGASMIKPRSGSNDGELYVTGAVSGTNHMKITTSGSAIFGGSIGVNGVASPGAPIDVEADSNAEALDIRGRSSDNIGEINFRSNDASTRYGRIDGRPDATMGLGLFAFENKDIRIQVGGTDRHFINGASGAQGSIVSRAPNYGIWTETWDTPNGGEKTVQLLRDTLGTWLVVGKIKQVSDLTANMSSTSSFDTSTSQTTSTQWSSCFGDYYPSQVRVLGSSNWTRWRENRSVDWVWIVPNTRPWKQFFTSGNSTGMAHGGDHWGNTNRYGFECTGCYDGFGEWHNPFYTFMRMSDNNPTISDTFFTTSGSTMNWHTAQDAKLSAHATAASSGQDAESHQAIGYDDSNFAYYRDYPAVTGNHNIAYGKSGGETPTWILLKVADPYTET